MLSRLELEDRAIWLEISVKLDKEIRQYIKNGLKIVEIERIVKDVELEKIEEAELARTILKQVDYMYNVLNYDRKTTIKRIAEIYGMKLEDAKEFVDYAEAQLRW